MANTAVFSPDKLHRLYLEREVPDGLGRAALGVIMVNPSKAGADVNDPTIVRVIGFAKRLGAGLVMVGNKFSHVATDITELRALSTEAATGDPLNTEWLSKIMLRCPLVIAAWGPLAKLPPHLRTRWKDIVRLADQHGRTLHCLGTAADGHPRHPLMLPVGAPLVEWQAPYFVGRKPFDQRTIYDYAAGYHGTPRIVYDEGEAA